MNAILTKSEKRTTKRTVERDYVLYPYPKSNVVLARVITKDTGIKGGEPFTKWYLFSEATYNKYKHRKTWNWIMNLGQDDLLTVMTVEYMDQYLNGSSHEYPNDKPKYVAEFGWKKVLDIDGCGRVAYDKIWYDHMMYNPQGKPIRRAFCFDYINGGLTSDSYDIFKVEKWLKRQKSVRNVKLIEVPYYNSESCDSKAVEFTFQPSHRIFLRMCEAGVPNTFEWREIVKNHLKLAKFKLPDRM